LGNIKRWLGLVLTSQGAAASWMRTTMKPSEKSPLVCSYCRVDGRALVSLSRHRCQGRQHRHPPLEGFAWKKETLDEIWRRKMMQRRRLIMRGLGFFPGKLAYLIYK
jgi:hypothetical protein